MNAMLDTTDTSGMRIAEPMSTNTPLVCVVDDDAAFRRSVTFLLESANIRVRCFASAVEFLQSWDATQPACLVADIRMPDMDGLELQVELQQRKWPLPTIFITGHGEVPLAVRAMKLGAFDFFEKPLVGEAFIERLQAAWQLVCEQFTQERGQLEFNRRFQSLSQREQQVLQLVIAGNTSVEIAEMLKVSPKTVEVHRANIMRKMDAQTVAHLVRMVVARTVQFDDPEPGAPPPR